MSSGGCRPGSTAKTRDASAKRWVRGGGAGPLEPSDAEAQGRWKVGLAWSVDVVAYVPGATRRPWRDLSKGETSPDFLLRTPPHLGVSAGLEVRGSDGGVRGSGHRRRRRGRGGLVCGRAVREDTRRSGGRSSEAWRRGVRERLIPWSVPSSRVAGGPFGGTDRRTAVAPEGPFPFHLLC